MKLQHMLGQLMFMGVSSTKLTTDEKKFITSNNIGGIVLFARNVESPEQIHSLCTEIQKLRHDLPDKSPFYIGIDMEGGRVQRLKSPFTQWPSLQKLGALNSPSLCFQFSYCMGKELKSVGINLDFAPCLDVLTNPKNTVIGDRSLSSDPEMVSKLSSALVRGYLKSEIMSCVKHFPGHGNTLLDSHFDLPIESSDLNRLNEIELLPFKKAFKSRVDMVMTSHILFHNIDDKWPVTLSEIFLKKIIREECRYRGLIISDDLDMKALTNKYSTEDIAVRAIEAGVDMLLYCNEPLSPPLAIQAITRAVADGRIKEEQIKSIYEKIQSHKTESLTQADPEPWSEAKQWIGHSDHQKIAQAILDGKVPEGLAS